MVRFEARRAHGHRARKWTGLNVVPLRTVDSTIKGTDAKKLLSLPFRDRPRRLHRRAAGARQYLAVGADGELYCNIGSPHNITMPTCMEAVTLRVDPKTGVQENCAQCVRNSVRMAFHLKTSKP